MTNHTLIHYHDVCIHTFTKKKLIDATISYVKKELNDEIRKFNLASLKTTHKNNFIKRENKRQKIMPISPTINII